MSLRHIDHPGVNDCLRCKVKRNALPIAWVVGFAVLVTAICRSMQP